MEAGAQENEGQNCGMRDTRKKSGRGGSCLFIDMEGEASGGSKEGRSQVFTGAAGVDAMGGWLDTLTEAGYCEGIRCACVPCCPVFSGCRCLVLRCEWSGAWQRGRMRRSCACEELYVQVNDVLE